VNARRRSTGGVGRTSPNPAGVSGSRRWNSQGGGVLPRPYAATGSVPSRLTGPGGPGASEVGSVGSGVSDGDSDADGDRDGRSVPDGAGSAVHPAASARAASRAVVASGRSVTPPAG
jgi:hypothetical protein